MQFVTNYVKYDLEKANSGYCYAEYIKIIAFNTKYKI